MPSYFKWLGIFLTIATSSREGGIYQDADGAADDVIVLTGIAGIVVAADIVA